MADDSYPQPSSSTPNLLCEEDKSCLNEEDEQKPSSSLIISQLVPATTSLDSVDEDDDYIQMLVQRERNSPVSSSNYPSWIKNSRIDAINWILNAKKSFGFQNHTTYLSVIYMDRFLSRKFISEDQSWVVSLLSVACLSLAAKMEEEKDNVPLLTAYKIDDYVYASSMSKEMEIAVLITLEWKMCLNTPFNFINYFIKELGDQETKQDDLISKATELVMSFIKESNSMNDFRPFVVAAAAVMAASNWQLTQDELKVKIGTVSLWEIADDQQKQQQEDELVGCYSIMQRLCANANPSTPNLTQVEQSGATRTTLSGRKRSLSFRDSDQHPDLPD